MCIRLSFVPVLVVVLLWSGSAVAQAPGPVAQLYKDAMERIEQGDYSDAIPLLQKVISDSADFAEARYNLGFIYEKLGAADSAKTAYAAALSLDSTLVMAYYGLGTLALQAKDYAAAAEHLRNALQYDSTFAAAYLNLGAALEAGNDLDGAITSFNKAIELKPDYADAYYQLAAAEYRKVTSKKDYPKIIEIYRKAVELGPRHVNAPVAHFYLARMYVATKQYELAVAAADAAVEVRPDLAQAYFVKGKALANLGRNDDAIDAYKKAIEKRKPYGSARYALARLYQKIEQYKLAVEEYRAAAEDPAFPDAESALKAAKSIEDYLRKRAESGG